MRGQAIALRVWAFVMPCAVELGLESKTPFFTRIPDPGHDVNQALEEEAHDRRTRETGRTHIIGA